MEYELGTKSWEEAIDLMRANGTGSSNWTSETFEAFQEQSDECTRTFAEAFLEGQKFVRWKPISANKLKRVWRNFGKLNYIIERDVDLVDQFVHQTKYNIVALHVGNILSGHSQMNPEAMLEDVGLTLSKKNSSRFYEFLTLEDGSNIISDYGLPYLYPHYQALASKQSPEEQCYTIDKVLNVVHQRGDLALFFVQGGTKTLLEVSEM